VTTYGEDHHPETFFVAGERRRSPGWMRVAHGLYVPVSATDSEAPLHALASRLHPDGGFTHLTAARLFGWWLPPVPRGLPEFAAQSDTRNRPRRDELRIIRTTPEPEVWWLRGLPVVPPTDALLALARHLSVLDMVVVLDSALRSDQVTPRQLALTLRSRRWGVRTLRLVRELADRRSESPFESLMRVLHIACEVRVRPQAEVRMDGRFVARGDLQIVGHQVLHEYDGADHRDRERHRTDLRRDRDLEAAGWVRRGYTDLEVLHRPVTILRDADRTLGRTHDPSRLDAWYALLCESCFTPAGRQRLLRRLGLVGGC
jgi:very-short-patch-repair endonuclease